MAGDIEDDCHKVGAWEKAVACEARYEAMLEDSPKLEVVACEVRYGIVEESSEFEVVACEVRYEAILEDSRELEVVQGRTESMSDAVSGQYVKEGETPKRIDSEEDAMSDAKVTEGATPIRIDDIVDTELDPDDLDLLSCS